VTIAARSVSSKHCELSFDGTQWHIRDMGSRNGTAVNGDRCSEMSLQPEDIISFAKERYSIRYILADGSPSAPAAAAKEQSQVRDSQPESHKSAQFGTLMPCGGGDPIPLLKPLLTVGRRSRCDITLRFATVSSEHCRLEFKEGFWFVREIKSTNGIKVDGVRCESHWLKPNSVLSIANLRYRIVYEDSGDELPPEENPFAMGLLEKAGLQKELESGATFKWGSRRDDQPKTKNGHSTTTISNSVFTPSLSPSGRGLG
jgi:pSer/pThr/pTyr-binding forkhead associated (FHA) protein